ncbi:MAG TPA: DUF2075 domain-containing protein [Candidatus Koribacter sp.]
MLGKRIDAVLLCSEFIAVIEIKTGFSPSSAVRQVEDYAIGLSCFHEESRGRRIVPIAVTGGSAGTSPGKFDAELSIETTRCASFGTLASLLCSILEESPAAMHESVNQLAWDEARFRPVPTIVDAAVALYSEKDIFEIGHACASRETLGLATSAIEDIVIHSRDARVRSVVFVTGVPGAGKTLVGLNAVHSPHLRNEGAFLSGNGPLVKILREALIRDATKRKNGEQRLSRRNAETKVNAFIHNVHRFAAEYYKQEGRTPAQHIIVFDEAQRAWNAKMNERKFQRELSEPSMLLDVMDRHADWAVIVALIGGGQEINSGEAGLREWGVALSSRRHWSVYASPDVITGADSTAHAKLVDDRSELSEIHELGDLHLKVSVRSIRARDISAWVNAVVSGDATSAAKICVEMEAKPKLTRNLSAAREWLSVQSRGSTRAGLVGSAHAARLRVDGLEPSFAFHRDFDWENWFLDTADDVRSSSTLEVFATQFEIQGLELDWVGVCWGDDFVWDGSKWKYTRFANTHWKPEKNEEKKLYKRNAYRVLLTRARQGMVIYVPQAEPCDITRLGKELDATAQFLIHAGAEVL